ncbi:MAG: hypothetical protein MJ188_00795 [Treponema sp.]|nr:hypothetical protein [Treponema sp.]
MNIKEKYNFGFDYLSLIIFALIMIPNIFWAFVPAKNDFLRIESVTPIVDTIASVFQFIFIATLCFIIPKEKSKNKTLFIASCCCVIFYFIAWIFYYIGIGNITLLILLLSVVPCLAFLFYELSIKNYISFLPTLVFTICHIIFAVANFII